MTTAGAAQTPDQEAVLRSIVLTLLAAGLLAAPAAAANLNDGHVGSSLPELEAQRAHSLHVRGFFTGTRHGWMPAPHRSSCWGFQGERRRRVCDRARRQLQAHRWLLAVAEERLALLYPWQVVCDVFGAACSAAQAVARCESHFRVWARNGQYRGMFQMGSRERAAYGHGSDAWSQARAARRDWLAAHGWGPWECSAG